MKVPGRRAFPTPTGGADLQVDDFPDGLVPFVGDPKRSRGVGYLLQMLSGLAAMFFVLLAVPNAVVWSLARKGEAMTTPDVHRMVDAWRLVDDTRIPALVGVLSVIFLLSRFIRSRRPREELAAGGEASVEAALVRICPRPRAITMGVLGAIGVAAALIPTSPRNSFDVIARTYAAKGIGALCLASALVLVFQLGPASRRHLERRLERSAGLDPADVPFVAPDTTAARDAAAARAVAAAPLMFREGEEGPDRPHPTG